MNEIHLHGRVKTAPWRYDGTLYTRISVQRTADRPGRTPQTGGNYDYVTVQFPGGVSQGLDIRPGQFLTVHGWVQSRDVHESLTDFLKRAARRQETEVPSIAPELADQLTVHRTMTEVVADRWQVNNNN